MSVRKEVERRHARFRHDYAQPYRLDHGHWSLSARSSRPRRWRDRERGIWRETDHCAEREPLGATHRRLTCGDRLLALGGSTLAISSCGIAPGYARRPPGEVSRRCL